MRTYQPAEIHPKKKEILLLAMKALSNDRHHFAWFNIETGSTLTEWMGTYGVIKGAQDFLVGMMPKSAKRNKEVVVRFGYDFEQLVLKTTELGLGTCWIAGTFNPIIFRKGINLKKGERIAMVSPVGISAQSKHMIGAISSRAANSLARNPWEELFFDGASTVPLSKERAEKYAKPLEMVRLAPSAVNLQPWRVIKDGGRFHFFGAETRYYSVKKIDFLRNNDLGIALSHFELTCRELGLKGKWGIEHPSFETHWEYIASWVPAGA